MSKNGFSFDLDPSDDELARLDRRCLPTPWCAVAYRDVRRNPHVNAWVVRGGGSEAIGFACFQQLDEEAELLRIAIVPERRREGWGRRLLDEFIAHGQRQGACRFFLEVRAGNRAARRLYESAGFRRLGARTGYFQDPPEDALIYVFPGEASAP
jgi:ribosomal-protein-alanine N-acetyltransferase